MTDEHSLLLQVAVIRIGTAAQQTPIGQQGVRGEMEGMRSQGSVHSAAGLKERTAVRER